MRFLRQSLVGLVLVSVTLGLLVYAGWLISGAVETRMSQEPRVPPVRERIFAVNVVPATVETITPVLTVFGDVQSRRTLELRAASGGTVIALTDGFEEGGQVQAGDLLVRIDPADAQAALARVESDLSDARAEQRDAERGLVLAQDELIAAQDQAALRQQAFERQTNLEERGVGTAAAVETAALNAASARQAVLSRRQAVANAEARVDQAATRLARAQIAVDEARRRLNDTEIRAGFDGTLANVSVIEGRLVSPNERLADLVDARALEVAFRVSTAQYARLLDENGDLRRLPVTVTLDVFGADLVGQGRLSRDSAAVGEGQTGRLVFAQLEAAPGMKPGDFVTVAVQEPPLDRVVRLPASALDAALRVLVLGAEDRLETIQVELMRRQGDDVLVSARDIAGREVVAEQTPLLGAGIRVRPLRSAPQIPEEPDLVELDDERRARLVAFVEGNDRIDPERKSRILDALARDQVPAKMVSRLESRMGG